MSNVPFFQRLTGREWAVLCGILLFLGLAYWGNTPTQDAGNTPVQQAPTTSTTTTNRDLSQDRLQALALAIQLRGYVCNRAEYGHLRGQNQYGLEFKVVCESGNFQAIVRPDNDIWVRTWANRLK